MRKIILPILLLSLILVGCAPKEAGAPTAPAALQTTPETTAPVETDPPTEPTEETPAVRLGYYQAIGLSLDGVSEEPLDMNFGHIRFCEDNTGSMLLTGVSMEFTWDSQRIYSDGETLSYVLSGDTVTLEYPVTEEEKICFQFQYCGETLPMPQIPEYYLISSVGINGDVSFYGSLDPENGYLKMLPDGTGMLSFNGTEAELTWDASFVYWNGYTLPYFYETYYDEELGRDDAMLLLVLAEENTSVAFRPAEEPES